MKKVMVLKSLLIVGSLFFFGCVHARSDREVEQNLQAAGEATSEKELEDKSIDWINSAPNLTDRQRERLSELRIQTTLYLRDLNQRSLQLKSLLFDALVARDQDIEKLNAIKKKIKKNESEKISAVLQAVDKAFAILHPTNRTPAELMNEFWFEHQRMNEVQ